MKKTISAIIILLLFLIPALSSASYLIRLKNGRQLATPGYWFEGRLIFFYIAGGTAGMERTEIDRIEKYETENDEKTESEKKGGNGLPRLSSIMEKLPQSGKTPADSQQKPSLSNTPEKAGTEAAKKDPTVMQEFTTLEKRFESRKNMSIDELNELKNELTALRDTIVSNHSEEDYREEIRKIADMRFFITDLVLRKPKNR